MAAITSGVELVRKLKASGTGEAKLEVARQVLREHGVHATAAQVVAALDASDVVPPGTRAKARAFMEGREYDPAELSPTPVAIEDQLAAAMVVKIGPSNDAPEKFDPATVTKVGPEKTADLTPELPAKPTVKK